MEELQVFQSLVYSKTKPTELQSNKQLFSEDICKTGAKKFFFTSYENIYKIILNNKYNHFYEDNTYCNKIKLFFDIDDKFEFDSMLNRDKCIDFYLNELLPKLDIFIAKKFKINDPKCIVLKSSSLNKFSLHIIYPEIVFENIKDIKEFVVDYMTDNFNYGIDVNPYKIGCFRMLYCSKKDKNNKLVLHRTYNCDYKNGFELFIDSCICCVNKSINIVRYSSNNINKICKRKYNICNNYRYCKYSFDMVKLMLDKLKDYNNSYDKWLTIAFGMKDLYLGSDNDIRKIVYQLFDDFSKNHKSYDSDNNNNIFHKLKPFDNNINLLFNLADIKYYINPIYDYNNILFNNKKYKNIITINSNYLTSLDDSMEEYIKQMITKDVIFIKSPTGTGKTTLTRKLKNKFNNNIISITSRVNLAGEHVKHLNLDFYKKMSFFDIYDSKNVVIQLESLYKCDYTNFIDGIVLLDEVNSLLSHFRSPTMNKVRSKSYLYFIELIKNAKKVICMDADLCDWNIDFINKIRSDEKQNYSILYNTIKNKINTDAIFYYDSNVVIEGIKNRIIDNIPVICCFDSLSYMKKIISYLSSYGKMDDWLIYSSEKQVDIINTGDWKNKFVFYTPSILHGIDYSIQETEVFTFVYKHHLNPLQIYQMINRCRKIKKVHVYCHSNEIYNKYKSVNNVVKETTIMEKFFKNNVEFNFTDTVDEEPYKIMYNNYKYIDSLLKTNILYYLKDMMKNKGFNIIENNNTNNQNVILKKVDKKTIIRKSVVKILGYDINNLSEDIKKILSNDKKIEQLFNYKLFKDVDIMKKIKKSISDNLVLESINNKYTKILLIKNMMKALNLYKLEDLTKDICKNFGETINDEWLDDNFNYIKKVFRIRTNKYNTKEYYMIYLLIITIIKNLFGNDMVKKSKFYENNKEFYYFIFNNNFLTDCLT